MGQAELLVAGLLVAVAGLSALARRLSVPHPIVLVGDALFGFIIVLPRVKLGPVIRAWLCEGLTLTRTRHPAITGNTGNRNPFT